MQATIAEYLGKVSFDHGQTVDCLKDQALYHFPGGKVECHAPRSRRGDCNERSLLRRYGAGVKILTMITIEKYTETREETAQSSSSGSMILDGAASAERRLLGIGRWTDERELYSSQSHHDSVRTDQGLGAGAGRNSPDAEIASR